MLMMTVLIAASCKAVGDALEFAAFERWHNDQQAILAEVQHKADHACASTQRDADHLRVVSCMPPCAMLLELKLMMGQTSVEAVCHEAGVRCDRKPEEGEVTRHLPIETLNTNICSACYEVKLVEDTQESCQSQKETRSSRVYEYSSRR